MKEIGMFWVAATHFDSSGIKRKVALYCYAKESHAKAFVRIIVQDMKKPVAELKPATAREREISTLEGFTDFEVMSPAEYADRFGQARARYKADKQANDGVCPQCETDFGRQKGRSLGRRAYRCLSCHHTWLKVSPTKPKKSNYRPSKDEAKVLKAA